MLSIAILFANATPSEFGIARVQQNVANALAAGVSAAVDRASAFAGAALKSVPALAYGVLAALIAVVVAFAAALGRWLVRPARSHGAAKSEPPDCTGHAPPIDAWLELPGGDDGRKRLALPIGLRRFGAEADNDVVLQRRGIARYHAAFEHTGEHDVYVSDLTRRNPGDVRVNGRAIKRQRLRDGDVVGISGCDVVYRCARRSVGNILNQEIERN